MNRIRHAIFSDTGYGVLKSPVIIFRETFSYRCTNMPLGVPPGFNARTWTYIPWHQPSWQLPVIMLNNLYSNITCNK